jgi:membrane protease YdiL (CAAX protease family)
MCLFGTFAHSRSALFPLAVAGLAATAAAVALAVLASRQSTEVFGLRPMRRRTLPWTTLGVAVGLAAGVWYRYHLGWPLLPQSAGGFVLVAALIGGTEELLYRGFIQGGLRRLGPWAAIGLTALLHAAYKSALFVDAPAGMPTAIGFVAVWTFAGGIVFGALREGGRNVFAPLAAHVAFDLVVYAELTEAPWWVWT